MTEEGDHARQSEQANHGQPTSENSMDVISPELQSAVNKLEEKKPEKLMEFMAMGMGSAGNPLHHKMTPEHISQVLDLTAKHDEREYELQKQSQSDDFSEGKSNRSYGFTVFLIVIIVTVIILFLFQDKPDVLVPILTGLGGLVGGFLGGWGLGNKQK